MAESGSARGVARALTELSEETSGLVRREVQAARTEFLDKMTANVPGVAMVGAAATLTVLSLASSHRWLLRTLEKRFPPTTTALLATVGYAAAAGAAGVLGVKWLREAPTPVPAETVRDVRQAIGDVTMGQPTDLDDAGSMQN